MKYLVQKTYQYEIEEWVEAKNEEDALKQDFKHCADCEEFKPYIVDAEVIETKVDKLSEQMNEQELTELFILAEIREIMGDPTGKLMLDELVNKIRNLKEAESFLRSGVIEYIKDEAQNRDTLKYLLDNTQWWDWEVDFDKNA